MTQTPFRSPSREEIQAVMREANAMRAETLKSLFAGFGRAIGRLFGAAVAGLVALAESFAQASRARELHDRLTRLSDRELDDMGLTRGDIPAVVAGVFRRAETPTPTPAPVTADVTALRPARNTTAADLRPAA